MSEGILSKGLSGVSLENEEKDPTTLSKLFDNAFELYNNINNTQESTSNTTVQADIRRTMRMFEDATKLVSMVDMFSDNESFEEVATENVKYFLLPALLGKLTTQICSSTDRLHLIKVAKIYFVDFLKRLKTYGLTDVKIPEINSTDDEKQDAGDSQNKSKNEAKPKRLIEHMVLCRNVKLQRYREEKDLESRLDHLKKNLDNPNIDDEVKREYYVTLLKLHAVQIIEELNLLETEKTLLENMKVMKSCIDLATLPQSQKYKPAPKLQPIIITRNEIQKKVFGAGYPSLPVLTVDEFYEQRIKDGDWPDPSQRNTVNSRCLQDVASNSANDEDDEAVLKEEMEEKDDPEYLERARAMDEYKDTHRRGWGNRANRS